MLYRMGKVDLRVYKVVVLQLGKLPFLTCHPLKVRQLWLIYDRVMQNRVIIRCQPYNIADLSVWVFRDTTKNDSP